MAECTSIAENVFSCEMNSGGIDTIWIADMDDVEEFEVDPDVLEITDLELASSVLPKKFKIVKNTASYTDQFESEPTAQSAQFNQELNIVRNYRSAKNSKYFQVLATGGRELLIVIKDNNGEYLVMANAQLVAVDNGSGTENLDGSRYEAQFVATNNTFMPFFKDAEDAEEFIADGVITGAGGTGGGGGGGT